MDIDFRELSLAIGVNATIAVGAFFLSSTLIPSFSNAFVSAGLKGRDLSKRDRREVPEALGVVSGAVFLISMFLFIPMPFYQNLKDGIFHSKNNSSPAILSAADSDLTTLYSRLVEFLAALTSICCMIFLGFADDVLDLRWRHKLLLPTLASLPLLMVYILNFNSTTIIVPKPFRFLFGFDLDLGPLYYVYMGMLAVFCTNAINIYAGINGLEVGQSVVICVSVIAHNLLEIIWQPGGFNPVVVEAHAFSLTFMLPFLAVALALLRFNWYPSQVFVGDTFCYFAGMTFAVVAILGHFSKTMLLFFIPQIFNFLLSVPQIFHLVPCPRHRLPKYDPETDLMTPSTFQMKSLQELNLAGRLVVRLLSVVGIVGIRSSSSSTSSSPAHPSSPDEDTRIEITNFTMVNFCLRLFGPKHEASLTSILVIIQVLASVVGFFIRYQLSRVFYDD